MEAELSKGVTHVFAINSRELLKRLSKDRLARFKGVSTSFSFLFFVFFKFTVDLSSYLKGDVMFFSCYDS